MKTTNSKEEIVNKWAALIFGYIALIALAMSLIVMWLNRIG